MRLYRMIIPLFLFLILILPLSGYAAELEVPDRTTQIKGFRFNESTTLDVNFALSTEFVWNIFKTAPGSEIIITNNNGQTKDNEDPLWDIVLHFAPGLKLLVLDQSKTIGMTLLLDYNLYTGADSKKVFSSMNPSDLSTLNIGSGILMQFNKDSWVNFELNNKFTRNSDPDSQVLYGYHTNLHESLDAAIYFKNTQGTFTAKPTVGFDFVYFEQGGSYQQFNYIAPKAGLFMKWQFLPKTAAILNISWLYQDYYAANQGADVSRAGNPRLREDSLSMPLYAFAGVEGQITPKIAMKLTAGYYNSFSYNQKQDVIGNLEFVGKFLPTQLLKLGYLRTYFPTQEYQYYRQDRIYFEFVQKLHNEKLLLKLDADFSFIGFGPTVQFNPAALNPATNTYSYSTPESGGTETGTILLESLSRNDMLLHIAPTISYNIFNWFGVALKYRLEKRWTPYYLKTDTVLSGAGDADYTRKETTYYDYWYHSVMLTAVIDY